MLKVKFVYLLDINYFKEIYMKHIMAIYALLIVFVLFCVPNTICQAAKQKSTTQKSTPTSTLKTLQTEETVLKSALAEYKKSSISTKANMHIQKEFYRNRRQNIDKVTVALEVNKIRQESEQPKVTPLKKKTGGPIK